MIVMRNLVGRWFRVPLGRRTAHGLITRASGHVCLGYFFLGRIPRRGVRPRDADLVARFGGYKLRDESWPFVEGPTDVDVSRWPIPLFYRTISSLPGVVIVSVYDDRLRFVSLRGAARRPRGAVEDCLQAPVGIERELAKLAKARRRRR